MRVLLSVCLAIGPMAAQAATVTPLRPILARPSDHNSFADAVMTLSHAVYPEDALRTAGLGFGTISLVHLALLFLYAMSVAWALPSLRRSLRHRGR